jgi:hypothetical protein
MKNKNIEELKEMLEKLSTSIKEMSETIEVSKKYPDNKDISGLLLQKRIEDGLIKNLHNASQEQLEKMKNGYWRYYKDDEMFSHKPEKKIENYINELIVKKKREKKIERILR